MFKIIGSDQKEYGPISAGELRNWILEARVNASTMVQPEGETGWRPLSAFPEFADLIPSSKPAVAAPPPIIPAVSDPDAFSARVLSSDIRIDAMNCIKRSWELYKVHFSLILPTTLVVFIAASAASAVPYLGFIVGAVLNGVLYGGLYWFFLKVIRGEKAELTDAFAGFNRFFQQLMLGGAVTNLLTLFAVCLAGLPFLFSFIPAIISLSHQSTPNADAILGAFGFFGILSVLFMVFVAFTVCGMWIFTFPLIIDKGLDFWPAMELSRKFYWKEWRGMALLILLAGIVGMSGMILCIVGVILTAPVAIGAIAYAYEDIFGSQASV